MAEALAPLMFAVAFALIFLGIPVAFALGGTALVFAFLGVQADLFSWDLLKAFPERTFGVMSNQTLLAVPFFIFMGTMLERSRIAQDLLHTIGLLFGPVRGGLALAVVFVGALLAAATGIVGASVVAMGMISLPIMLRYGYAPSLAAGVICASGTLGQIVPPSIVLVVLGDQLGVSVGKLFQCAFVPGAALAMLFAIYVLIAARLRPDSAPALPREERNRVENLGRDVVRAMIPPLLLIVIVLGSIFTGRATPTEAGAFGAVGAMLLAAAARRLDRSTLRGTMQVTTKLTCMIMFLLIGSTAFTLVFRGLHGDDMVVELLGNLPGERIGMLIVVNLLIFGLGFFIDFFEIAFIILPLLVPVLTALEFTGDEMIWFGVIVAMNLQTSFLTPPFGFSLFYLRGVAPASVTTTAIYRGVVPFIIIQLIALALVIAFPDLVMWPLSE